MRRQMVTTMYNNYNNVCIICYVFGFQICQNGKIQLNFQWSWWWPRKFGVYRWFKNMAIIAPFWATIDEHVAFKAGHSKVYYHVYQDTKDNNAPNSDTLQMASRHVQHYDKSGKFSNFNATWVLVVTWEKLCPYVYYPYYYYYSNNNGFTLNCQWVGIGPLQLAVTWYKIRHAGEQATHWDIQNKANANLS